MSGALVPLTPVIHDRGCQFSAGRPNAAFVAHLIAMSIAAPQTRVRRRAEPIDAAASYGQVRDQVGQWPTPSGRSLSHFL